MDKIFHNNFLPSHFFYFRPSGKLLHLDGTPRPVNVVLNEMEKVRKKDRLQKTKPNSNSNDLTHEKKRGRPPKILRPQKIVKWKFMHDGKIPRMMDMESYRKNNKKLPVPPSSSQWNFSSDESLDRNLDEEEVLLVIPVLVAYKKYSIKSSLLSQNFEQ